MPTQWISSFWSMDERFGWPCRSRRVEYKKQTGKSITDPLAIAIAGHYLKTALQSGEGVGREMYSLTVPQTLEHLEALVNETPEAEVAAV